MNDISIVRNLLMFQCKIETEVKAMNSYQEVLLAVYINANKSLWFV